MSFASFQFLIFFPIVLVAYYALPVRFRPLFLLLASCYFYVSFVPAYIFVLFGLITADYALGRYIAETKGRARLLLLWCSVAANIGALFFFKYFNFFNENAAALAHALHWNYSPLILQVALPLGLSFHVFQSLSYTIEVYRGRYQPERSYFTFALYVMFFPQLVSGPIERPYQLLPQLHAPHEFDALRVRRGLERMLWGFFKKLVIADNAALVVNAVYAHAGEATAGTALLAALLFTYQLYCDFSGYTDIAIGAAQTLGIDLVENFNRPFAARSIAEFWRRWHMSLTSWMRDYVYYPLAFSWKLTPAAVYASLFITFLLIGFWHGPRGTYLIFGAMNGGYLIFGQLLRGLRNRFARAIGLDRVPAVRSVLQTVITFSLVSISLILFRATSLAQASELALGFFRFSTARFSLGAGTELIALIGLGIAFLEVQQYFWARPGMPQRFERKSRWLRWSWYYVLIAGIIWLGYIGGPEFIYFQF